jgi:hypothetical protein
MTDHELVDTINEIAAMPAPTPGIMRRLWELCERVRIRKSTSHLDERRKAREDETLLWVGTYGEIPPVPVVAPYRHFVGLDEDLEIRHWVFENRSPEMAALLEELQAERDEGYSRECADEAAWERSHYYGGE